MWRPRWPDPYHERPAAPAEPAAWAQTPIRSARAHTGDRHRDFWSRIGQFYMPSRLPQVPFRVSRIRVESGTQKPYQLQTEPRNGPYTIYRRADSLELFEPQIDNSQIANRFRAHSEPSTLTTYRFGILTYLVERFLYTVSSETLIWLGSVLCNFDLEIRRTYLRPRIVISPKTFVTFLCYIEY